MARRRKRKRKKESPFGGDVKATRGKTDLKGNDMSKGNRNRNNRKSKTIEHYDGYTITRWIDEKAGDTPDDRSDYWDRTESERRANGELDGLGFVYRDPRNGEVLDFTFDDEETCKDYWKRFIFGEVPIPLSAPMSDGESLYGAEAFEFPSLGIGKFSLDHPNAEQFVSEVFEWLWAFRSGRIPHWVASVNATGLYIKLGMDKMPDAA